MRMSEILRGHEDEIANEWATEARRKVGTDAAMPPLVLLDHVPALLSDLISWLENEDGSESRDFLGWEAQRHARDRLVRDFDLREVVDEYRILRHVLLRRAAAAHAGDLDEVMRVDEAMDLVIGEAAERFARDREGVRLAQAQRSRLALEATDIGTWEWFPRTDVIYWDERCHLLLGIPSSERVKYPRFLEAVHAEDRARVDAQLRKNVDGEDRYRIEYRTSGLGGSPERWIEARGEVLSRGSDGRADHFVGTVLDITWRQQAAAFRERFLGIVSHDLRNPISAIALGASRILVSEDVPLPTRKLAERILVNAQRMTRMIADLLDLTRGRLGGGIPVARKATDLPAIAQPVLETLRATHPEQRIEIASGRNLEGAWDPDRLGQVMGNLVANALEHGDRSSPVRVELLDAGPEVAIRVHNMGPPIPPEDMPHIFEAFRQARRGAAMPQGLGLGLFIASEIVRAHAGRIEVTSTQAEGTTFCVTLPRG
jgi:signal transduction histidine kinase